MKKITAVVIICAALLAIIYSQFIGCAVKEDPRGTLFAGSLACAKCHSSIHSSYIQTAHYLASNPADQSTVHGSFARGVNVFAVNDTQQVIMERHGSELFQTYYLNNKVKQRYQFDIVMGGVKGESYLFWNKNELYQLPLSYITHLNKWSTSPGLGFDVLNYAQSRSINSQCLQCHASYISDLPGTLQQLTKGEQFDKATLVYHIDCERCHGPAAKHVKFQTNNPGVKTARFITSYRSLNRLQKVDMCALCHSGKPGLMLRSGFGFVPGDTLANFRMPDFKSRIDTNHLDVHGNQLQLLQSSKCYRSSAALTCTTCHNVHQNSRGNVLLYAQKCLGCHNTANHTYCKMTSQLGDELLKEKCIGCHMPAQKTNIITAQVSEKAPAIRFSVHTHHIAIYPSEVKRILAFIKK